MIFPHSMGDSSVHKRDVSLALDRAGLPIIAYHTFKEGSQFATVTLNVTRPAAALDVSGNCGPQDSWRCEGIADIGDPGDYLAIAVNPSGLATIAYYNSYSFGSLRVAYQPPFRVYLPLIP